MSLYTDEEVNKMHPRQAAILIKIPEEDRYAVLDHAHFRQNISGGTLSSCLWDAVRRLEQLGSAQALLDETKTDNAKLMHWS